MSIFRKRSSESNDGKFIWAQELVLKNLKHKPKLVLCPKEQIGIRGRGALFYEELTHGSRINVNESLYKLWDTFQPSAMDTNCGYRTKCTGFHWKIVFESKAFIALLKETFWNSEKESSTHELKELTEFIEHFEKLSTDYVTMEKQKLLKHHASDLMFYNKHFILLDKVPKTSWAFGDKYFKKVVEEQLLFNLDESSDATSICLEFKTNETKKSGFKMIKYAKDVNKMIDELLSSMQIIQRRCNEYMKSMKNKVEIEVIDEVSGWFKLNILTREEKDEKITIVVEAQVTLFTFVFFIWYFRNDEKRMDELKKWLKSYKKRMKKKRKKKRWVVKRCKVWDEMTHEFHFMKQERKLYPLRLLLEDKMIINAKKKVKWTKEHNGKNNKSKIENDDGIILKRRKSQDVRNSFDLFLEKRMSGSQEARNSQDVRDQ